MAKKNATRIDMITDGMIDALAMQLSITITFCMTEHGPTATLQVLDAIIANIQGQRGEVEKLHNQYVAANANGKPT